MQANKISVKGNLFFIPNQYLPLLNILDDYIKDYARIDFFKPDLTTEDNYIQESGSHSYTATYGLYYYYCSNNLEGLTLSSTIKIAKEELVNSLEFSITPELSKENRMYLMFMEAPIDIPACSQLDEDRCDLFFVYPQYQNLFLDTTNALTHTFKSGSDDYNLWCLVLDPVMKTDADGNEIPLYHDEIIN